jgi:hypothetical protein
MNTLISANNLLDCTITDLSRIYSVILATTSGLVLRDIVNPGTSFSLSYLAIYDSTVSVSDLDE